MVIIKILEKYMHKLVLFHTKDEPMGNMVCKQYGLKLIVKSLSITWERSGRVLDWRLRGRWFEPHQRHCVVVFEQDTFILA